MKTLAKIQVASEGKICGEMFHPNLCICMETPRWCPSRWERNMAAGNQQKHVTRRTQEH